MRRAHSGLPWLLIAGTIFWAAQLAEACSFICQNAKVGSTLSIAVTVDGTPFPDAQIAVQRENKTIFSGTTNAAGTAFVAQLVPGSYRMPVTHGNHFGETRCLEVEAVQTAATDSQVRIGWTTQAAQPVRQVSGLVVEPALPGRLMDEATYARQMAAGVKGGRAELEHLESRRVIAANITPTAGSASVRLIQAFTY